MVLIAVSIIAGLWFSGGPMQARRDRFDNQRLKDFAQIRQALSCARRGNRLTTLPEQLTVNSFPADCLNIYSKGLLVDEETGKPYRYERLSGLEYRICADFHDSTQALQGATISVLGMFDAKTGCMSGKL
jgi:hypothetical protein